MLTLTMTLRCHQCLILFLLALVPVISEHEPILCAWLSSQWPPWDGDCTATNDICSFNGVTCTEENSVTYYKINLTNKGLTGSLPEDLASMTTLREIDLEDNMFSGPLPASWSALSELKKMLLRNNMIDGTLPDSWSALTSMEELDLRDNELSGTLPASWQEMTSVIRMKLANNALTGGLPSEWSAWTNLERLNLKDNSLSGQLPSSWSSFSSLKKMDLADNQLTSTIPESWASLTGVTDKLIFDANSGFFCNVPSTWVSAEYSCTGTAASAEEAEAAYAAQIASQAVSAPIESPDISPDSPEFWPADSPTEPIEDFSPAPETELESLAPTDAPVEITDIPDSGELSAEPPASHVDSEESPVGTPDLDAEQPMAEHSPSETLAESQVEPETGLEEEFIAPTFGPTEWLEPAFTPEDSDPLMFGPESSDRSVREETWESPGPVTVAEVGESQFVPGPQTGHFDDQESSTEEDGYEVIVDHAPQLPEPEDGALDLTPTQSEYVTTYPVEPTDEPYWEPEIDSLSDLVYAEPAIEPSTDVDGLAEPVPQPEPEIVPVVDDSTASYCSSAAISCHTTSTGFSEELLLGSLYILSPLFSGLTVYGLKSIDTTKPTRPDIPYTVIIHLENDTCVDTARITMEVHVRCPEEYFYCETEDTTFCSPAEICVDLNAQAEDLDAIDLQTVSTNGPTISLQGPEAVQITVGDNYLSCEPCQEQTSLEICDEGASAWDSVEGNLTPWIEACSTNSTIHYFSQEGLSGCAIDTSAAGFYNITLRVRDSTGQVASVQRQLTVLPLCPEGEFVCMEVLQCSVGESCFMHTGKVTEKVEIDLDSLGALPNIQNNTIDLVTTEQTGRVVNLTVGRPYQKCETGVEPSADLKCEPGVSIQIFSGQETEYEIYACPSGPCRYAGNDFCDGSSFAGYGLEACNLDTSAVSGTQYEIQFMAVPENSSMPILFVSRFLVLESLCGEELYQCDEVCSPVPCDYYTVIVHDAAPVITTSFPNGLTLAYGVASQLSILPCSIRENCGVQAADEEDGDLTSSIFVAETTPCSRDVSGCQFCDPDYLSSGDCLPGYYQFTYSVEDSAGNTAELVTLEVNIVEISEFVISLSHVSASEELSKSSYEDRRNSENVTALKAALLEKISVGLEDTGKTTEFSADDLSVTYADGVMLVQTCFVGMGDKVGTVNVSVGEALQNADPATVVPAIFRSSSMGSVSLSRRLLQVAEDASTLEDVITVTEGLVAEVEVDHLNLVLSGTHTALLTEEVDYTLGAIASVLGEMNALYQESVSHVASLVESVRASLPDSTKLEKELMSSIENMFLDKSNYDQLVEDGLHDVESFDALMESLEELLNATRSAVKETRAMMNAQLKEMNHMRDYQGFLTEVELLTEEYTCIGGSAERRHAFNVPREEEENSSRKLLQIRGGTARTTTIASSSQTAAAESSNVWGAYTLNVPDITAFGPAGESMTMETMLRGATNDRNFIIGGAVIQTDRTTKEHICYGRFAHLVDYCYAIPLHRQDMSQIPYGRDPVFLVDSNLYDEDTVLRKEKYYDTQNVREMSASGIPFGFQPSEIKGKLGTHFVYLDIQFGRATVAGMLQYLSEGQFLDAMTEKLVLRFVTYNPQFSSTILAVNEMECVWRETIECEYRVDALPDIKWSKTTIATTVLISLLVLTYWGFIVHRTCIQDRPVAAVFVENLGDVAVALIMTAALCVSIALVSYEVSDLGPRLRFVVYDSSHLDGAHWLLHKRQNVNEGDVSQRWTLPENATDIYRLADFLQSMTSYRSLASVSSVFHTFAIFAVILRLFALFSVLPRISLITHTLKRCISPLLYFLLPFSIVVIQFAAMAAICFGHRVSSLSSFSNSMGTILEFVFFGGGSLASELTPEGVTLHPLERIIAALFNISLSCLSLFIFINFVLAILTDSFLYEKTQAIKQEEDSANELRSFGSEIYKQVTSFVTSKRARTKRVTPSLSDIGRVRRVMSQLQKTPFTSFTDSSPTVADFRIKPPVHEFEMSPSRVACVNKKSGIFAEGENDGAQMPVRGITDILSLGKSSVEAHQDSAEVLKRVEEGVLDLLNTYEAAQQWATRACFELIHGVPCAKGQ